MFRRNRVHTPAPQPQLKPAPLKKGDQRPFADDLPMAERSSKFLAPEGGIVVLVAAASEPVAKSSIHSWFQNRFSRLGAAVPAASPSHTSYRTRAVSDDEALKASETARAKMISKARRRYEEMAKDADASKKSAESVGEFIGTLLGTCFVVGALISRLTTSVEAGVMLGLGAAFPLGMIVNLIRISIAEHERKQALREMEAQQAIITKLKE